MSSYIGRHAELYDIFYEDKSYVQEAAFADRCLRENGVASSARLLELACGTGRHAFEMQQLGYHVVATDYSEDMLACARQRAKQFSPGVDFRWADMRSLDLDGESFDAAICLFDSIGYVLTNDAVTKTLSNVRRHLRPDGLFLFEFWHAAAMLRGYDPVRVRRWATPDGELIRISETTLDCRRQVAQVTYTIFEPRSDGLYETLSETQSNRFFQVQEMAALLSQVGFAPVKWFAGYANDEDVTENTWHVVALARRTDG